MNSTPRARGSPFQPLSKSSKGEGRAERGWADAKTERSGARVGLSDVVQMHVHVIKPTGAGRAGSKPKRRLPRATSLRTALVGKIDVRDRAQRSGRYHCRR